MNVTGPPQPCGGVSRRAFLQLATMSSACAAARADWFSGPSPDFRINIAPYVLEASPDHKIATVAYNGQVPGPLLRMREGQEVTVEVHNGSHDPEVVHWHGLFLPSEIDGAMEEGTAMIGPGASARYIFMPRPAGFRWFHTHTFAGRNLRKAQYSGQHGFLMVQGNDDPGAYDREVFLGLHDWSGYMAGSDDSSMDPVYPVSTINGKMLGHGGPIRVKHGERVLLHVLNSSPTETHWVSLSGHPLKVIALDGNQVPNPVQVEMLRLAPAERVSAIVEMNNPGSWVLGEVRRHIQAAGMGIVFEYENSTTKPVWRQPAELRWSYQSFAAQPGPATETAVDDTLVLAFNSRFRGHGSQEVWTINGKSYPDTEQPLLKAGRRYKLLMRNRSSEDHPVHLHRHLLELTRVSGAGAIAGLKKDTVVVPAMGEAEVEFVAEHPGKTLFHCHQQNHMDSGFMMVFRYA